MVGAAKRINITIEAADYLRLQAMARQEWSKPTTLAAKMVRKALEGQPQPEPEVKPGVRQRNLFSKERRR